MTDFQCVRCGEAGERITAPPFRNDLGNRIYDSICRSCWEQWLKQQTAIINHYALNLMDPQARQFLSTQTETYLFGETTD